MTPKTKDGLATITFFQHEYEMWKEKKKEKKLAVALFAVTAISVLLSIRLAKHR